MLSRSAAPPAPPPLCRCGSSAGPSCRRRCPLLWGSWPIRRGAWRPPSLWSLSSPSARPLAGPPVGFFRGSPVSLSVGFWSSAWCLALVSFSSWSGLVLALSARPEWLPPVSSLVGVWSSARCLAPFFSSAWSGSALAPFLALGFLAIPEWPSPVSSSVGFWSLALAWRLSSVSFAAWSRY